MTDKPEDPVVAGDTQIEGMVGFFETQMRMLGKAMSGLQDDTRQAFGEVHQTVQVAKGRNQALRAANARFRAFLGFSNQPVPELKQIEGGAPKEGDYPTVGRAGMGLPGRE